MSTIFFPHFHRASTLPAKPLSTRLTPSEYEGMERCPPMGVDVDTDHLHGQSHQKQERKCLHLDEFKCNTFCNRKQQEEIRSSKSANALIQPSLYGRRITTGVIKTCLILFQVSTAVPWFILHVQKYTRRKMLWREVFLADQESEARLSIAKLASSYRSCVPVAT